MFQIRKKSFFNYDLSLNPPILNDSKTQNNNQNILTEKHLNKPKTRPKNNTEGYSGVEILETECTAPKTPLRSSVLNGVSNESSLLPKRKKNSVSCMCHDKENTNIHIGNINQKSSTVLKKENSEKVLPSSKSSRTSLKNKVIKAKVNSFNCTDCDYKTNLMGKLKLHLKIHDKDKHQCSQCDYSTNINKLLQKHQKSHSRTTVKNSKSNLATNWNNKKSSSQSAHSKVEIDKSNKKNLKKRPESYKCPKCNYSFKTVGNYVRHFKRIHNLLPQKLKCDYCTFETHMKYVLEKHTQKHFGSVIIKCPECDYVTNDKYALRNHSMCHSTINLKCTKCDFTTHRKDSLRCHLKNHLNV